MSFSMPSDTIRREAVWSQGTDSASPRVSDKAFSFSTRLPVGLTCKALNQFLLLSIQCSQLASMPAGIFDNKALPTCTTEPTSISLPLETKRPPQRCTASSLWDSSFSHNVIFWTLIAGVSFRVTFPMTSALSFPSECSAKTPKLDLAVGKRPRNFIAWASATGDTFPLFVTSAEKPDKKGEFCTTACVNWMYLGW